MQMKIYKMRIENYRGIKDSGWLEFNQINAIVGRNDAGKSSVLYAINAFYNENKLLEEDRYFGAGDAQTVIEIIFDGEQLLDIPAVLLDNDRKLHIKKSATQVGEAYKNTIIVRDFENALYKNILQLTASKHTSLFRGLGLDVPETIDRDTLCALIDHLLVQETNYVTEEHEIKSAILKGILKELYPQYSLFSADTNLDTGASTFQNQFKKIITNAIEAHIEEFSNLQEEVSVTLNDEVDKIGRFMVNHYPSMSELKPNISYDWSKLVNFEVIMKDNAEYEVDLSHKGTGIQRLFMVSYFQYLAEQSVEDTGSYIFALEEPETFLHPGAQRTLLDSLKKIAESHQVIITTHSPVFASEISNHNITVAIKTNVESVYKQGNDVSTEVLVEELGIRASDNILSSKLLVFVEGSNDVKFWKIIYNLIIGHDYEEDEILLVPGGGNELHNIAEMNLMSKLNRNFMVIVDKDAGAVDYAEKLAKQEHLRGIVEDKGGELVVLRKREIENYYCARVVTDMLSERGFTVENLVIEAYEDFPAKMKRLFAEQNVQMKFKNNMDIFAAMSLDDWKDVSTYIEDGVEHFELGEIVARIVEKIS